MPRPRRRAVVFRGDTFGALIVHLLEVLSPEHGAVRIELHRLCGRQPPLLICEPLQRVRIVGDRAQKVVRHQVERSRSRIAPECPPSRSGLVEAAKQFAERGLCLFKRPVPGLLVCPVDSPNIRAELPTSTSTSHPFLCHTRETFPSSDGTTEGVGTPGATSDQAFVKQCLSAKVPDRAAAHRRCARTFGPDGRGHTGRLERPRRPAPC